MIKYTQLTDQVDIYNYIDEAKAIMDIVKNYDESEWGKWGSFGKMAKLESSIYAGHPENFNSEPLSDNPYNIEITKIYNKIFGSATNDYIQRHGLKADSWRTSTNQLCFYNAKKVKYTNLVMAFHTDFQQEKKDVPGPKHFVTANLYLNDNYEGGEIIFMIDNDENNLVRYKPKAGDLVVFPSGERYRHGVRTVDEGKKYFIRSFWHYISPGSPEWHAEKSKYSEEEWSKMEDLRQRIERNSYMKWIKVD